MATLTKKRKAAVAKFDGTKLYDLAQAAQIVKQVSSTKFDATVDIAVRLGVDPKKSTEMVRGTVSLPHGTGRTVKVLVLADPASAGTIPAQRWSQLAMHHEVIVLLLIDPLERMPPHARLPFVAAGGGRIELGLDAEDTRQRWHREFSGSVDATLADLHARGIRAVELSCADPGDAWLPLLDRGGRSR